METRRYHSALGDRGPVSRFADIQVGGDSIEKCGAALTKLLVPEFDSRGVGAFQSLRKAYVTLTGDEDISGFLRPEKVWTDIRSSQDFNSSTFSYALNNAMNVYLSKAYKDFPYHEDILISEKKKIADFRQIKSVQIEYFGELPPVDPETGDYAAFPSLSDTEAEYRVSQKGGLLFVTRRMVIDDNIELIKALVKRAGKSARLAHAKYVWNFFISNALCPDGTAWFTVEHGNLGANALDIPDMIVAIKALANMTEPGPSGEKIGIDLPSFNWHLVVPTDNWDLAARKNQQDSYYTGSELTTKVPNACHKLFGDKNERVITCPFMTAPSDWGLIRDREDVPIIEMSYMNGHEVPELIQEIGPKPLSNMLFVSDKLGFKMRHEYGGVLAGYRGAYKAVVE